MASGAAGELLMDKFNLVPHESQLQLSLASSGSCAGRATWGGLASSGY